MTGRTTALALVAALGLAALGLGTPGLGTSALAAEEDGIFTDILEPEAPQWLLDEIQIDLGGFAQGTGFTASYPGSSRTGTSAYVTGFAKLQQIFDTGLIVGARGDFLIYRDTLSGDNYANDTVERLYFYTQTGFGRVEIGQTDGAGAVQGFTGPHVDDSITLESRTISLFRDPSTGGDFGALFTQKTVVQASSNYAKISYSTPRLFGVQLGASFMPHTVRSPLPFTGNPSDAPNDQGGIWEVAGSYSDYLGDTAVGISAAYAHGGLRNRTPGFENYQDYALGLQLAQSFSGVRVSAGAAYRYTNAYLLDLSQAYSNGRSRMVQSSVMAEMGNFLAGAEFSYADIDGPNDINVEGAQVTGGYKLSEAVQLSAGWQWYNYHRGVGVFYTGSQRIRMNAGFLTLSYRLE